MIIWVDIIVGDGGSAAEQATLYEGVWRIGYLGHVSQCRGLKIPFKLNNELQDKRR